MESRRFRVLLAAYAGLLICGAAVAVVMLNRDDGRQQQGSRSLTGKLPPATRDVGATTSGTSRPRPEAFTAEGILELRKPMAAAFEPATNPAPTIAQMQVELEREAALIQSIAVLNYAIHQDVLAADGGSGPRPLDRIKSTAWYKQEPSTAMERLRKELTCAPMTDGPWIRITMSAADGNEAIQIVNAVGDAAIHAAAARFDIWWRPEIQRLGLQIKQGELEIAADRAKLAKLLAKAPSTPKAAFEIVNLKLSTLVGKKAEFTARQTKAESELNRIRELGNSGKFGDLAEVRQSVERDSGLRDLRSQARAIETDIATLLSRGYSANDQEVINAQDRLDATKAKVERRESKVLDSVIESTVASAERELVTAVNALTELCKEIDSLEGERRDLAVRLEHGDDLPAAVRESIAAIDGLGKSIDRKRKAVEKLKDGVAEMKSSPGAPLVWRSWAKVAGGAEK